MAANSNVYMYIKENFRKDVILLNETGCYEKNVPLSERKYNQEFNILWVGKFDYRKQLELAIRSVSQLGGAYPFIKLNIVGDNDNSTYSRLSKLCSILNIEHNVVWHGKIPNKKVHQLMQESDIFLFTSIDEGTPHVVLESIQNNLPIVCFDTCGQGDVVNDSVGIKIPLSNATQSPSDFARAISSLINDRKKLHQMRINCSSRQKELSWDTKIQKVVSIYDQIISQK